MRYFAIISYNGANYCGWQIQQNSRTIEQMVEYALSTILGEKIDVVGAGRTDSGVNAIEYIAHFDASDDTKLLHEPGKILYKTNNCLFSNGQFCCILVYVEGGSINAGA